MKRVLIASMLTTALLLSFAAGSANACPTTIPEPANAADCACFATVTAGRCGAGIAPATCINMQNTAWAAGLLTADGLSWLQTNNYCPVHGDFGAGDHIYSICPAGCFAADTQILTDDQTSTYTAAATLGATFALTFQQSLMTMSDDATVRDVALTAHDIARMTSGPEEPKLFVFALGNGSTLRVTQHHPMVLNNGKIIEAAQVDEHMSLAGVDGRKVTITSITRENTSDDVFNFLTTGDTTLSHIIVAEGVLVGDLKLQNELEFEQASIKLRR